MRFDFWIGKFSKIEHHIVKLKVNIRRKLDRDRSEKVKKSDRNQYLVNHQSGITPITFTYVVTRIVAKIDDYEQMFGTRKWRNVINFQARLYKCLLSWLYD